VKRDDAGRLYSRAAGNNVPDRQTQRDAAVAARHERRGRDSYFLDQADPLNADYARAFVGVDQVHGRRYGALSTQRTLRRHARLGMSALDSRHGGSGPLGRWTDRAIGVRAQFKT